MPAQSPPVALILAAGRDTRFKSRIPKVAHPFLGKSLGRWIIDTCHRAGIERVVVVVGPQAEQVRSALGEDVEVVEQLESLHEAGPLLILSADYPLLEPETLTAWIEHHLSTGAALTALTDPAEMRVIGATGTAEALALPADEQLEDLVAGAQMAGKHVERLPVSRDSEAIEITDRVALAQAVASARWSILQRHMLSGVTIEDLDSTYIDADTEIGIDTVIRPLSFLQGQTRIGEGCVIGPSVTIKDCVLGDGVQVQNAVLAGSEVGDECKIGPFAQLRPGCRLGRKVKVGNFVELKNAQVEDRVSIGHLAYVGDASVGEKTNVGAGTITCNYDGKHKHRTKIGKGAFIGSHSTLVAPVELGDGAFTAAGTVVTQDVPDDALAIGRSRQTNKEQWARRYRELQERGSAE